MPNPAHSFSTRGDLEMIRSLEEMTEAGPIAVLTGAGVSTDSGIPDYRGAGTPPRTPMSVTQFLEDERYRKRFWAGALINSVTATAVEPNAGHVALARLEDAGHVSGIITQNVDDLHLRAGSRTVVELHGNGSVIRCTGADHRWSRTQVLEWVAALNPTLIDTHGGADLAPDGDALVSGIEDVIVPACPGCGALLRPNVVYFGEHVPTGVFADAERLLEQSAGLLIAGSSLAVNTGLRLVHRAERQGMPVAVVNRGPTAIDHRVKIRLEAGTSETLTTLADRLGS